MRIRGESDIKQDSGQPMDSEFYRDSDAYEQSSQDRCPCGAKYLTGNRLPW
jgi:hypothetical protein